MKIKYTLLISLTVLLGCSPEVSKPKVSISQYAKQVAEMNHVIQKLMNEPDAKVMHDMAFGVESARMVLCDPIGEECNLYYKLINKMINLTNDDELSEADRNLLLKMNNQLQDEIKRTEAIVIKEWHEFVSKNEGSEVQK